jgi:DNA-binding LacI/PurR family transcriptional regulator
LSNDTPAFRASFDATGSYSYIDDNYVSLVVVSKKYGIINDKGESVVPATFDDADAAYDALSYLYSLGKVKMGTFETFRYKLNHNPDRNGTKLSDKIADDLWDF